jgi:beta-glucanase (GH16 family)
MPTGIDSTWELTFSEEFNNSRLNSDLWTPQYHFGQTSSVNEEKQYYVPEAISFSGGTLNLTATRNPILGKNSVTGASEVFDYRSGMIAGHDKRAFTYGYMEMRAKLPTGQGLWPAFWMLPSSKQWPPEIDVMEFLGNEPQKVYGNVHYRNSQGNAQQVFGNRADGNGADGVHRGANFADGYHTFAVKWEPGKITWYVDGNQAFSTTSNVPSESMYLLANLAVGGKWPGNPDGNTLFPSTYSIDYIRVYQNATSTLHGGNGNDTLTRNSGTISGEAGDDRLTLKQSGNLYGGSGSDRLTAGSGTAFLMGNSGNDVLIGGTQNDQLVGSDPDNKGAGEIDQLQGNGGNDVFVLGSQSGTYYKYQGNSDYAWIRDFAPGDVIKVSANETYQVVRDAQGFNLYAVGANNWRDLIADVYAPANLSLPTGNIYIGSGQTVANIFQGI